MMKSIATKPVSGSSMSGGLVADLFWRQDHGREGDLVKKTGRALPPPADGEAPKRQRPAYHVLFAVWLSMIVSVSNVYTFGVFLPSFQAQWPTASKTDLGLTGSFFLGAFLGGGLVSGRTIPRFGHQKCAFMGAFGIAAGWACCSLAMAPWQLYLPLAVLGLSSNHLWAGGMSLIPAHFPKSFAKMSGVAATGAGFGTLIVSAVHSALLARMGWRQVYQLTAVVFGALAMLCAACYTPPPDAADSSKQQPSSCSGGKKPQQQQADKKKGNAAAAVEEQELPLRKDPVFLCLSVGMMFGSFGFLAPFTHLAAHAGEIGCDAGVVRTTYMLFGLVSIVGRLCAGFMGDKFGSLNVYAGGMFCFGLCVFCLGFATDCSQVMGFTTGMGLASGPYIGLMVPMIMELFGMRRIPLVLGQLMGQNCILTFASPAIAGLIRDATGEYHWAYLVSACAFLLASANFLNVKRVKQRRDARRAAEKAATEQLEQAAQVLSSSGRGCAKELDLLDENPVVIHLEGVPTKEALLAELAAAQLQGHTQQPEAPSQVVVELQASEEERTRLAALLLVADGRLQDFEALQQQLEARLLAAEAKLVQTEEEKTSLLDRLLESTEARLVSSEELRRTFVERQQQQQSPTGAQDGEHGAYPSRSVEIEVLPSSGASATATTGSLAGGLGDVPIAVCRAAEVAASGRRAAGLACCTTASV